MWFFKHAMNKDNTAVHLHRIIKVEATVEVTCLSEAQPGP